MKAITYTDEEAATYSLVKGPVWTDACGHEHDHCGSYVTSFSVCHHVKPPAGTEPTLHNSLRLEKYDLYVFPQKSYGQEVCIRYGHEGNEYISPGSLGEFLTRSNSGDLIYRRAAQILLHFGRATWQRKDCETQ